MNTNFSRHAYERVLERLTMDLDEVASLLDWDLAIKIGDEKRTHRIHRLFYSREDHQCFIAIQDEKTKTVVTILPVDYYEALAAKIPVSLLTEAEQLVSCPAPSQPQAVVDAPGDSPTEHVFLVFRLRGTFMNMNGRPRTAGLGSWPAENYKGSVARLLQDAAFYQEIRIRVGAKMQMDEYLAEIMIRMGNNGEAVWLNVEDDGSALTLHPAGQIN